MADHPGLAGSKILHRDHCWVVWLEGIGSVKEVGDSHKGCQFADTTLDIQVCIQTPKALL